jgi:dUTP pyrophosphatase
MNLIHPQVIYTDDRARGAQLTSGSPDSAGLDVAIYPRDEDGNPLDEITIVPGQPARLVHTGVRVWIGASGQRDCFGMVVPRSSVGHKLGVTFGNTAGIIDSDYQGELFVSLVMRGEEGRSAPVTLKAGDRIGQMIFLPFLRSVRHEVSEFTDATDRGTGGVGSTGR